MWKKASAVTVIVLTAALTIAGCGKDDANGGNGGGGTNPSASASPSATPNGSQSADPGTGKDFYAIMPADKMPMPSQAAIDVFGEQQAREGAVWAVGLAEQSAYDVNIWSKITADGATRQSLTSDDYLPYAQYMTTAGKTRWITSIKGDTVHDPVKGPGIFVLLPTIGDGYEWSPPSMRPNGMKGTDGNPLPADSFDVKEITVGTPQSSFSDQPTLKVVFDDVHVYEFKKDGKDHAVQVRRPWTMLLAQTQYPDHPWLLEDWTLGEVQAREVPPASEVAARVSPTAPAPLTSPTIDSPPAKS